MLAGPGRQHGEVEASKSQNGALSQPKHCPLLLHLLVFPGCRSLKNVNPSLFDSEVAICLCNLVGLNLGDLKYCSRAKAEYLNRSVFWCRENCIMQADTFSTHIIDLSLEF